MNLLEMPRAATHQAAMRVLLAEDEKKVAAHVRKALREAGFVVDMVHRGDEALECALGTPYDVLILDVMMPGRDGLSILKLLREKSHPVPVLLLTARGEVSERVEGLMLGADDYPREALRDG
jgi:DNA-binding response OmpR family regulator